MSAQPDARAVAIALMQYASGRLQDGYPADVVQDELVEKGLSREMAGKIVAAASDHADTDYRPSRSGNGAIHVAIGLGVCALGVIATVASYSSASPGDGYTLWWGAILFGGVQVVRGLATL